MCYKCMRPLDNCFCKYTEPFDPGVKFIFLMHPKEAKRQKTGTGRIAHIGLIDSEIIIGIDFTKNERLCKLLADPQYYPMLLYPGDDAWTASKPGFKEEIGDRKLLAIIIDSTWFCSHKMIKYSTNIMSLPKLSFSGAYRSIYTFKHEPRPECVSTIETCYYLIHELADAGIISNSPHTEGLMTAFKEMVKFQLIKENDRVEGRIANSHASDWKYKKRRELPSNLLDTAQ